MNKIFLILFLVFLPVAVLADDQIQERPHWSLELKGGLFYPALSNWNQYYGDDKTEQYGAAFAYKFTRWLELGIEAGYASAQGQGFAPLHGTTSGKVTYELYPVNVFVLFRGLVDEKQWIVPYVGGGFTRIYYSEKIEFQNTVTGYADGYHARGGLQFLLDGIDQSASNGMYLDYGVFHTYFFIEAFYSSATVNTASGSVDLGGTGYMAGLLFEF